MGPIKTRTCGCRARPRRRCELCDPGRLVFTACGSRCLATHLSSQHPDRAAGTAGRAQERQAAINRARQGWDLYEPHRTRLGRLLRAVQRGDGLCVLGAGQLRRSGSAGAGARVRRGPPGRPRRRGAGGGRWRACPDRRADASSPTPGLDLSGDHRSPRRLGRRSSPTERELAALAGEVSAAHRRAAIGRTLRRGAVGLPAEPAATCRCARRCCWAWRTGSGCSRPSTGPTWPPWPPSTRPGGTGVLALDVTSLAQAARAGSASPSPATWDGAGRGGRPAIARRARDPQPRSRAPARRWLTERALAAAIERPRLTDPWVWDTGGGVLALVYALLFSRADAGVRHWTAARPAVPCPSRGNTGILTLATAMRDRLQDAGVRGAARVLQVAAGLQGAAGGQRELAGGDQERARGRTCGCRPTARWSSRTWCCRTPCPRPPGSS